MKNSPEYELYLRRRAFEALLTGTATAEQMALLDLEPGRRHYALALFSAGQEHRPLLDLLMSHFLKYPAYILLEWGPDEYLVIIKAAPEELNSWLDRCADTIRQARGRFPAARWHAALTPGVDSPAALPECYALLSRLWASRYQLPGMELLTPEGVGCVGEEEACLMDVDIDRLDPSRLWEILETAAADQAPELVAALMEELGDAVNADSFCRFLALGTRFTAARFARQQGWDRHDFIRSWGLELPGSGRMLPPQLHDYLIRVIQAAINCRESGAAERCRDALRQAVAYIGANFHREELRLEQVAEAVERSPNYLSALFRKELGCTFVEYMTMRRMARARELLEQSTLRSGEIARAVGYRDPRYFSSLFKKTQGVTPMDYRKSKKNTG